MKTLISTLLAIAALAGAANAANLEPTADWGRSYKCYRCH